MVRMSYAQYENLIEPNDLSHPTKIIVPSERGGGGWVNKLKSKSHIEKKVILWLLKEFTKSDHLTHPKTHGAILLVVEMFG